MAIHNNFCYVALILFMFTLNATSDEYIFEQDSGGYNIDKLNTAPTEFDEQSFQEGFNDLFENDSSSIDTTAWCTTKINTIWFDYRNLNDTIKLVLTDPSSNLLFTFPCPGEITSPFGMRQDFWHYGMDTRLKTGDTVRCAFDGKIRVIQNDRYGYGKVVVVRHRDGLETLYGHLSKVEVTTDSVVKSGDVIGLGGNTGHSTGSHLHFETRYCGQPFNPERMLDYNRITLLSDTLCLTKDDFHYVAEIPKIVLHKIRKGETLGNIAKKYRTNVRKLCALNGISRRTTLRIGRKLIVRKYKDPMANVVIVSDNKY